MDLPDTSPRPALCEIFFFFFFFQGACGIQTSQLLQNTVCISNKDAMWMWV